MTYIKDQTAENSLNGSKKKKAIARVQTNRSNVCETFASFRFTLSMHNSITDSEETTHWQFEVKFLCLRSSHAHAHIVYSYICILHMCHWGQEMGK